MTSYWDEWGYVLNKIKRGEKVDVRTFLNAVGNLINTLHDYDHEHGDHEHTLDAMLRKNETLEAQLEAMGSRERMPSALKKTEVKTDDNGWITLQTASQYFNIHGHDLRKLRAELKGTHHMKEGNGGQCLFSLDYLKGKFRTEEAIPERMVVYE